MRQLDRITTYHTGGLGRKVEPRNVVTPDREVSPGIYRRPDGKLYTAIPANEQSGWFPVTVPRSASV